MLAYHTYDWGLVLIINLKITLKTHFIELLENWIQQLFDESICLRLLWYPNLYKLMVDI
jgi:hypothetical protein